LAFTKGELMAKKSKQSRYSKKSSQSLASMSVDALFELRDEVAAILSSKAAELQRQLARLGGGNSVGTGKRRGRPPGRRGALKGTKVAPQFRSKKNPKLTWSGRGAMAGWMKEEMKGTKLKKEDFRIAR
jgi:DNA-binding protein H-NS